MHLLRSLYRLYIPVAIRMALLVILLARCDCKTNDSPSKKECRLRLEATKTTVNKGALTYRLKLTILEGKCTLQNYRLCVWNQQCFQNDNWTLPQKDQNQQTIIEEGSKEATSLFKWLDATDNPTLQEGESKQITIHVTQRPNGRSSVFAFFIVNKKAKAVSDTTEVRWTTAG